MHDNAWVYDLEVAGYTEDLSFWRSLVSERGATRVLDLACGTGRITFPLASHLADSGTKSRLVGLDNSPALLAAAREKRQSMPEAVRNIVDFVDGDMTNFCLDQTFDLILIGFNSLLYLYDQEDQISCLRNVRKHLAPGGSLAFDILVPALDYLLDAQRTPVVRLELDFAVPERGIKQFLRFSTERYDAATQLSHSDYFYEIYYEDGRHQRFTDKLDWQMIFPREMELLGKAAGLKTVAAFGDFNRTPFNRHSRQMVWIMEAE
jgi:SAM-dependent methyltransferase